MCGRNLLIFEISDCIFSHISTTVAFSVCYFEVQCAYTMKIIIIIIIIHVNFSSLYGSMLVPMAKRFDKIAIIIIRIRTTKEITRYFLVLLPAGPRFVK